MRRTLLLSGFLLSLLIPISGITEDEDTPAPNGDACRAEIDKALAKELRIYRTVLFGRKRAVDTPIGEVRYDKDGGAFYKTAANKWISSTEEYDYTYSNYDMDRNAEVDSVPVDQGGADLSPDALPRRGILDTKRTMTSELIPYLTQAFRAFNCRVDMVCNRVEQSTDQAGGTESKELSIRVSGCIHVDTEEWNSIPACHFAGYEGGSYQDVANTLPYCQQVSGGLIQRENDLLKMLVEYDAAYRSLLQFAGVFDEFLQEFRWTITGSIRTAASVIGSLGRIPCFVSSCDEYPPSSYSIDTY
ncbi:MAG: hypothetical protein K9M03_02675 [Kiritimatiellales bacterium]|nr:hypothetical protein [Kiritimatiellales bacterium]